MKIGVFLLGITAITILSLASLMGLLFYFDPFETEPIIIVLVYLTLLFGLTGLTTLIGFFIRRIVGSKNLVIQDAASSFWQGCVLALAVVSVLVLVSRI